MARTKSNVAGLSPARGTRGRAGLATTVVSGYYREPSRGFFKGAVAFVNYGQMLSELGRTLTAALAR